MTFSDETVEAITKALRDEMIATGAATVENLAKAALAAVEQSPEWKANTEWRALCEKLVGSLCLARGYLPSRIAKDVDVSIALPEAKLKGVV